MYSRVVFFELVAPSDPGFGVRPSWKQRRRQRQTRSCTLGWTAEATSFPQTPNLAALLSHTAPQRLQRLRAARPPCRATFRSDGAFTGGAASVTWKSDLDDDLQWREPPSTPVQVLWSNWAARRESGSTELHIDYDVTTNSTQIPGNTNQVAN